MRSRSFSGFTSASLFIGLLGIHAAQAATPPAQLQSNSKLPANPGDAGNATLAGIDANANGVRDDLEGFIVSHFGKRPKALRGVANTVIGLQAAINSTDDAESGRAQSMIIISSECLSASGEATPDDAAPLEELMTLLLNTPARTAALMAHKERADKQEFAVRDAPTWDKHCESRVDQRKE